ncbi:hypothetical protein HOA55_00320 [archaeon]|jgi:hypothetical protein|nr:hypothetical protein [archaeon]MBT3577856.1 hypothetical protein [archaeon]MBT6819780.1 hypothetical protein [archaeon]MBT6955805.1 hypothetical protein [archaeon]MBT7025562.1 hypothetical protein [archaeon]
MSKRLRKILSEEPIKTPGSPFWNVFKRFGRDEVIAMIINVVGTTIAGFYLTSAFLLSIIGPIIEKLGFFPANFLESFKIYKTTPKEKRKSKSHYFKGGLKRGMTSLGEDILIHDLLYIILLFTGLKVYPAIPIWLLSASSFIIAVFLVSLIEVTITEIRYIGFKKRMAYVGFKPENYIETRFLISSEKKPNEILDKLADHFDLDIREFLKYEDLYFDSNFPQFSGRKAKVRLRKRTNTEGKGWLKTAQVIYTRARESQQKKDQFRFFPIKKEKFYFFLDQRMPKKISKIENSKIRRFLKSCETVPKKKILFERSIARSEALLASVDKPLKGRDFFILELKTRNDTKLLVEAMRFAMQEFPVLQTTKGKSDIAILS